MQPKNLIFGGGATETVLNPIVACGLLIAIVLILVLPRNKAVVPFLLAFFTIPLGQVILVGGLHFTVLRILILTGLVRVAIGGGGASTGRFSGGFNRIDKVVVLWIVSAFVIVSIQWMALEPFIKFAGDFLDAMSGYMTLRFLISDEAALRRAVKALAVVCLVQGVSMMGEQFTRQNVFAYLGAVQTMLRNGHVRSQGVMGSIQGGAFAGVLIPLFIWLWRENKSRPAAFLGLAGATAMVFASHASTSWMAYAAGLGGLSLWPLRKQMRLLRRALAAVLVALHLYMRAPVWALIARVDITGGSNGYHRYMLVDNCIRHFWYWWLIGYNNYASWGFDMWDLCNQFVAVALTGGLISLVFFIMVYSRSFGAIGDARKRAEGDSRQEWFFWCLGSVLFANVAASFGINYMLQLEMLLFSLWACVSIAALQPRPAQVEAQALPDAAHALPVGPRLPAWTRVRTERASQVVHDRSRA